MPRDVVIWFGPVATANLAPAVVGTEVSILTINGQVVAPDHAKAIKPSDFTPWVSNLGPDPLGALLTKAHADRAYLAAFSAGAGGLEGVLQRNAGDPRILGVLAADAYFGLTIKPGYMAQAKACEAGGPPFWLTTGATKTPSGNSGAMSVKPFADALGMVEVATPAGMPPTVLSRGKGSVVWLNYEALFDHIAHATKLAPDAIRAWLTAPQPVPFPPLPFPPEPPPPPATTPPGVVAATPSSPVVPFVSFVAGLVVGYLASRVATNHR